MADQSPESTACSVAFVAGYSSGAKRVAFACGRQRFYERAPKMGATVPCDHDEPLTDERLHRIGLAAVEAFAATVNAHAEAAILAGEPITGAHHRAIEAELEVLRAPRQ